MPDNFTIYVQNLTSDACATDAREALSAVDGIEDASVYLTTQTAQFSVSTAKALKDAFAALEKAGYPATLTEDRNAARLRDEEENDVRALRRAMLISVILALPVILLETGSSIFTAVNEAIQGSIGAETSWQLQSVLTAALLLGPGRRFFSRGVPALLRGRPDINSMVALGTFAAFLYSAFVLAAPELLPPAARVVYFEVICLLIPLILLGRWREASAVAVIKNMISSDADRGARSLSDENVGTHQLIRIPRSTLVYLLIFAPLSVALIAMLVWSVAAPVSATPFVMMIGMSVLITSCFGAVGLIGQFSTTVAMRHAAKRGIFFQNSAALQLLHRVTVVAVRELDDLPQNLAVDVSSTPLAENSDLKINSGKATRALAERGVRVLAMDKSGGDGIDPLIISETMADTLPPESPDSVRQVGGIAAYVGGGFGPTLLSDMCISVGSNNGNEADQLDIVLAHCDLPNLLIAIDISEKSYRAITQNLVFASGLQILLLPVAAGTLYPHFGVLLSPSLMMGAVGLLILFVILNGIRMRIALSGTQNAAV